ncbi:MAG: hypothetical protein PHI15_08885 [Methanomicrobium sp.]|nr:hypothetical protein [Methanomicrobium sp.]
MTSEYSLCIICAWSENCRKKFLKGNGLTLKCPDFTRDLSIKNTEIPDDKKTGGGDNK